MSEVAYKNLITKTFRDNAIRSVVMIDDEYLRYDELVGRVMTQGEQPTTAQLSITSKAAKLHKFFRTDKKISCDIDNGVDSIDAEKIRKSDLVILDYQLERDDPRKSIGLIQALQANQHMNLVVVYTREDLNNVWLQLAACLRLQKTNSQIANSAKCDANLATIEWEKYTENGTGIPEEQRNWIGEDDLASYMLSGEITPTSKVRFAKRFRSCGDFIRRATCENLLAERSKLYNPSQPVDKKLVGSFANVKWLQTGNVFVVLHKKSVAETDDEATELWNSLTVALQDWNPSYYQLAISEVQNLFENEALPFDFTFIHDTAGQAAWLSSILSENNATKKTELSIQFVAKLIEELTDKFSQRRELVNFHEDTIKALAEEAKSRATHDFHKFSAEHMKLNTGGTYQSDMFHALNASLCSTPFNGRYITNGTVLKETGEGSSKWYLCVSPACDTVPSQTTSKLAKRIAPDRLIKLIVLSVNNTSKALENATSCRSIFIYSNDRTRIALAVQDEHTRSPEIEYAIVHNHAERTTESTNAEITVSFLTRDGGTVSKLTEAKLLPVCQLRDSYTARYQTVASHHLGRVGVDYVNYSGK